MKRSRKVVVLCHCLLNANVKVHALATYPGIFPPVVAEFLEAGIGILQLPCPETTFLGLNRWGMTREQYDIPAYRRHCRRILIPPIDEIEALQRDGCELTALIGVNGSPSCGISLSCSGYGGGEIASPTTEIAKQIDRLRPIKGPGIFMQELLQLLAKREISIPLMAVDEENPTMFHAVPVAAMQMSLRNGV